MAKGERAVNPAERQRAKEAKAFKDKTKKKEAELKRVRDMLNDPALVDVEIEKVQKESQANRLDKSLKDKLTELSRMKEVALQKQQTKTAAGKLVAPRPIGSSSSSRIIGDGKAVPPPPVQPAYAALPMVSMRPQDSVYYHPQFNPTGAPPPGQPMRYHTVPQGVGAAPQPGQRQGGRGGPGRGPGGSRAPFAGRGRGPLPPPRGPPPSGPVSTVQEAAAAASAAIASAAASTSTFYTKGANHRGGRGPGPRGGSSGFTSKKVHQQHAKDREGEADPLDPASTRYNQDLVLRNAKAESRAAQEKQAQEKRQAQESEEKLLQHQEHERQQRALQEAALQMRQVAALPIQHDAGAASGEVAANEEGEEDDDEFEVDAAAYEDDDERDEEELVVDAAACEGQEEEGISAPERAHIAPSSLIRAEELMQRRFCVPSEGEAAGPVGQKREEGALSADPKEIMKRRLDVPPARPDDAGIVVNEVGPARPPVREPSEEKEEGESVEPAVQSGRSMALSALGAYSDSDSDSDGGDNGSGNCNANEDSSEVSKEQEQEQEQELEQKLKQDQELATSRDMASATIAATKTASGRFKPRSAIIKANSTRKPLKPEKRLRKEEGQPDDNEAAPKRARQAGADAENFLRSLA